jgi:2-dehydro-3-deoxyglucarate aldolase/4-hydroxy-2-oxoheptanedioate aldolase
MENRVKRLLKNGQVTAGAWLQLTSPMSAELMARAGFDWLIIDMEHAPGDYLNLAAQIQAMGATDCVPFVRAPWNDPVAIKRILDTGTMGVLIPYVNSGEEARQAVAACKYPPDGIRGVAGSPRAAYFGQNSMEYLRDANQEILVIVAVETGEAIDNLDEILATDGLDGIFIGPMDLATSMGHFGDPSHPEVQEAIGLIEKKTISAGKFLGTVGGSWEQARKKYDRGYQLLMLMSDSVDLAKLAGQTMNAFTDHYRK